MTFSNKIAKRDYQKTMKELKPMEREAICEMIGVMTYKMRQYNESTKSGVSLALYETEYIVVIQRIVEGNKEVVEISSVYKYTIN